MASGVENGKTLPMGKGCMMIFKVDPTKPEDSIDHHWVETSYDGAPGSWVPEIGSHWHAHHDEYMRVLSGRIAFTLAGKEIILTPSDGALHIPRFTVHSFKFFPGEATTFTERTDPAGDFKEDFFRDLMDTETGQPSFVTAMRSFYDGDTFVATGGPFMVDRVVTTVVGGIVKWLYPRGGKTVDS